MIGVYDYTVILTYLSLLSAGCGVAVSLGYGNPFLGGFFLLICGLCDAFDGRVARTKCDRTEMERNFGIQIDSLSDLIAFGVLPACIGTTLLKDSHFLNEVLGINQKTWYFMMGKFLLFAVLILYVLAALIRLAYYNVTEEERQKTEDGVRKTYTGLPVTVSCFVFSFVLILDRLIPADLTLLYFAFVVFLGVAFVSKFRVPKPAAKGIICMVAVGVVEFAAMICMLLERLPR